MSSNEARVFLDLLCAAEQMSSRIDREDLFRDLCFLLRPALGADAVLLYAVRFRVDCIHLVPMGWSVADVDGGIWRDGGDLTEGSVPADPFLVSAIDAKTPWYRHRDEDGERIAVPVSSAGRVTWLVEIHVATSPSTRILKGMVTLARTFEHLMVQWEHANLDTLTGLLNRKTFDDQFDRLMALAESQRAWELERRHLETKHPCWLGIVDIDHFKQINDSWGHLFGDEVLILMAKCMRDSFRTEDTLFRFGGEEFVVMLRHVPEDRVQQTFERFRLAIQTHEFPQVGQVTCSIGYCHVDNRRTPAELLARADEALYYAKDHGRNQVWNHDELVMKGVLKPTTTHSAQEDADLFF
jgi:diguanylate cyclase (GGDEF)-like protein